MTDDRADTAPPLVGRERIAQVVADHSYTYPDSMCECNHLMSKPWQEWPLHVADAVLAALPTPGQYVAGLADDETLVERMVRVMYDGLDGPPPPREARVLIEASIEDVLRALAAALTERSDRG